MAEKIRIKDIAERAGVSVGTVDRVLHDRPNVSKPAREKVEQALKEMNYQPNMYASALAYNKSYTFYLLLPKHESEAYWEEIEEGARKCEESKRDFHINVKINFYERSCEESFIEQGKAIIEEKPEGVIIVPSSLEITRALTDQLHELNIPFILLDSYMPDLRPLSFFGQWFFRCQDAHDACFQRKGDYADETDKERNRGQQAAGQSRGRVPSLYARPFPKRQDQCARPATRWFPR